MSSSTSGAGGSGGSSADDSGFANTDPSKPGCTCAAAGTDRTPTKPLSLLAFAVALGLARRRGQKSQPSAA